MGPVVVEFGALVVRPAVPRTERFGRILETPVDVQHAKQFLGCLRHAPINARERGNEADNQQRHDDHGGDEHGPRAATASLIEFAAENRKAIGCQHV